MDIENQKGWIRISRQIEDWPFYFTEPFTRAQAWIDLLILTNHKDTIIYIRGNKVEIKRGQVCRSEEFLSSRWKWSRGKVRSWLKELKTVQQIVQQKTPAISLITILNYEKYQSDSTTDSTTERQQTVQQKDNRQYTYNNVKNVKNGKKGKGKNRELAFPSPLISEKDREQLIGTMGEGNLDHYLATLSDYCLSSGKRYKDYAAAIRNWYRSDIREKKITNDPYKNLPTLNPRH